jgi:hypothetical protein
MHQHLQLQSPDTTWHEGTLGTACTEPVWTYTNITMTKKHHINYRLWVTNEN